MVYAEAFFETLASTSDVNVDFRTVESPVASGQRVVQCHIHGPGIPEWHHVTSAPIGNGQMDAWFWKHCTRSLIEVRDSRGVPA